MSVHNLAQQVQSQGRGSDSVLVHMTPNEVHGLQALALAHGGSLTINPETGLPEAGFLSKILPMVAGALLAPMTAGTSLSFLAANPLSTALTIGGLTGLATGSLNKGLMAGLGAFGGAGLGQGLAATGAKAATAGANAATAGAASAARAIQGAPVFPPGSTPALDALKTAAIGTNPAGVIFGPSSAYTGGLSTTPISIPTQLVSKYPAHKFASSTVTPMPLITSSTYYGGAPINIDAAQAALGNPVSNVSSAQGVLPNFMRRDPSSNPRLLDGGGYSPDFTQMKQGFKAIGADPVEGLKSVWENMPAGTGLASIASVANAARPDFKPPGKTKALIRPYRLKRNYEPAGHGDTGYGTSERRYFDDVYTALEPYEAPGPEYAAGGGLMGLASFAGGGYTRYTGTRPLDEDKDDYYYVGGMDPHFMYRPPPYGPGSGSPYDEYDPQKIKDPYKYDYDREIGKFVQKSGPGMPTTPKLSTDPQAYTAETLNPVYQQYFGRDVDPEGIAAYTKREFSPFELDTILKASPEYAARQQQLAAAKKEASYATATQAANMYRDLLGRTIDPEGLKYYTQEQRMTPAELKKTLMQSEEYLTKLTKPLAPKPFVTHSGAIGLEGAMRTPEQEAARPRDMSNFYAMMDRRLAEQAQRQQQQPEYAVGGSVEQMSAMNSVGDNLMYPQSQFQTPMYSNPMMQHPMPANVISTGLDAPVDSYTGEQRFAYGGVANLGGYSDGGRLLKGPGDGVSDSIPAVIGQRQPARLADGEFVIPARIVSELGNGSTEAGARKLYAMMDRVQKARNKTVGKKRVAVNSRADKHLPA